MVVRALDREGFEGFARDLLQRGHALRFRAHGISMRPFIRDGDLVEIVPVKGAQIRLGDVILCSYLPGWVLLHRVVAIQGEPGQQCLLIQGDAVQNPDGIVLPAQVLGRVHRVWQQGKERRLDAFPQRIFFWLWAHILPYFKMGKKSVYFLFDKR